MAISDSKKIKLFNKTLKEFIAEYSTKFNKNINKTLRYKTIEKLEQYKNEIKINEADFLECKGTSIRNLTIVKELKLEEGNENKKLKIVANAWRYLHNLYFIVCDLNTEEMAIIVEKSRENIGSLLIREEKTDNRDNSDTDDSDTDPISNLLGGMNLTGLSGIFQDPKIKNIMQDTFTQVQKAIENNKLDNENVNPMDLLGSLLSGKSVGGLNILEMVGNVVSTVKNNMDADKITQVKDTLAPAMKQIVDEVSKIQTNENQDDKKVPKQLTLD